MPEVVNICGKKDKKQYFGKLCRCGEPTKNKTPSHRGKRHLSSALVTNAKTEAELIEALNSPISYDDSEFVKKYCTYDRKDAPKYILSHIFNGEDCCKIERVFSDSKERVLFYCGGLQQNGLTASFKNLLQLIDLKEKEYYLFPFKYLNESGTSDSLQFLQA